ncbi:hypothetical protein VHA_002987 [Grimontia hollisae CIP 101886]|uniref:Uncharacterized protein n=1 Tax=Grimontia hollisae CIP 101886 TaxID=675812 RepID=D0IB60_GRIHO|nr:hypothetical protein VHA_002987 [Grimontia hollisae CIP 101886]
MKTAGKHGKCVPAVSALNLSNHYVYFPSSQAFKKSVSTSP